MNFFHAAILGFIEGFTEFLPISSTFHLIFASKFLGLQADDFLKLFEVVIQTGAVAAVVVLFLSEFKRNHGLIRNLTLSFIPTAIIGFFLQKVIKDVFFETTNLMIIASFVVGIVFIVIELLIKKGHLKTSAPLSSMRPLQAVIVGLVQAAAVIPGVSRSGATILGLLLLGFNRPEAALYSFLLAVPVISAAGALDLIKSPTSILLTGNHFALLLTGLVFSFIFAYLSARWLINFLKHHTLIPFGIYRIVLSPLLFLIFK